MVYRGSWGLRSIKEGQVNGHSGRHRNFSCYDKKPTSPKDPPASGESCLCFLGSYKGQKWWSGVIYGFVWGILIPGRSFSSQNTVEETFSDRHCLKSTFRHFYFFGLKAKASRSKVFRMVKVKALPVIHNLIIINVSILSDPSQGPFSRAVSQVMNLNSYVWLGEAGIREDINWGAMYS